MKAALITNLGAGIIAIVPSLIYFNDQELSACRPMWPMEVSGKLYYISIALVFCILPLCVITVLYVRIANRLHTNFKNSTAGFGKRIITTFVFQRSTKMFLGYMYYQGFPFFFVSVFPKSIILFSTKKSVKRSHSSASFT